MELRGQNEFNIENAPIDKSTEVFHGIQFLSVSYFPVQWITSNSNEFLLNGKNERSYSTLLKNNIDWELISYPKHSNLTNETIHIEITIFYQYILLFRKKKNANLK